MPRSILVNKDISILKRGESGQMSRPNINYQVILLTAQKGEYAGSHAGCLWGIKLHVS